MKSERQNQELIKELKALSPQQLFIELLRVRSVTREGMIVTLLLIGEDKDLIHTMMRFILEEDPTELDIVMKAQEISTRELI